MNKKIKYLFSSIIGSSLFVLFFLASIIIPAPSVANAAVNELNTTINLQDVGSLPTVPEVPTINVLPNTTYTYTLSITNSILLGNDVSRKVSIVYLRPRLPNSFTLGDPVTCPANWEELNQPNFGRGVGIVNCVELGLDTTSPTTASNPQYDLKYGQTANITFTFTTPSSGGITDLNLAIGSINSAGVLGGGFGYVAVHIAVGSISPAVDNVVINNGRPINANANHGPYPYNPTNETAVRVTGHVVSANKVTVAVGGGVTVDITPDVSGNFSTSLNLFSVGDGNVLFTITPKNTSASPYTEGAPVVRTVAKDTWIPRIVSITSDATTSGVLTTGNTITFTLSIQDVPTPDSGEAIIGSYNGRTLLWSQTGTNGSYSTWRATYTVQTGDQNNTTPLQITGVHAIDGAGNESDPRLSNGSFNGVDSGTDIQKTIGVYVPIAPVSCTSWTYSSWSSCSSSGSQTRSMISSSPSSCTGGNPVLSQSCTYTPPVPSCTATDWSCGSWGACSQNGNQTRTCSKISNCQGGVSSPTISQSCIIPTPTPTPAPTSTPPLQPKPVTPVVPPPVYQPPQPPQPSCTADTWTCGDWNSCSLSGVQNRSCRKTFDCPSVETAPPTVDQYCEAPNRPTQQVPQDSDAISNQDTIIKATVKLLCVVDENRGMWGSGTVIDSSGTILTNKHVVDGAVGCLVGFVSDFNDEPYFGDRQIADILKVSSSEDVATIKMRNPQNKKLSYVNVANSNSNLRLGTKINIYGYPIKFGTNITYTSGDFSGTNGSYLKTTAIIESGNSGGGAYLSDGNFIGIPTAVIRGEMNALGYILSVNTINAWLGNSAIAYRGNSNQNNFSRVSSVLESIDLKKLDSIKLLIPKTDNKGNNIIPPATPTTSQSAQATTEQPQTSQPQKESNIIESSDKGQKVNPSQDSPVSSEKEPAEEKVNDSVAKISEQRRSVVANAVQEISDVAERSGGIGEEIKTIAQTQTQNQEKLETGLQKIQDRGGLTKFFIGPNYGEIKTSQKLLEQNKGQIQKLNELGVKLSNRGDKKKIEEQIQLLEGTNQQIETSLNDAQKGFSLLGWMFKLFAS